MTRGEYGYELKYTQTPSRSDRSTFTPSIYKLSRPEKPQKDFFSTGLTSDLITINLHSAYEFETRLNEGP
ncbi:hypothetical protein EYR41_003010 [Orbilia oligospora]|uniref:Uncharacterized protein n=1 Tax=Orbilia oligospora TaxID=2813651 RepID=A0A8H2E1T9_ORBOL|nr:hypothetical protein EYR41_003010 [Orbilia oligospora]